MSVVQIVALALVAIGAILFLIATGRLGSVCGEPGQKQDDYRLMLIGAGVAFVGSLIGWINF